MIKVELDEYSIKARLYPTFIVLLPILAMAFFYITNIEKYYHYLTAFCAVGFLTFVLAQLGRDRGKSKEPVLFQYFGGKPTTLILRHNDNWLNSVIKDKYHASLSLKMGINIPSATEEMNDLVKCDQVYEACGKYLISKTRDTNKFRLLFKENINYGFRRNLWGMKAWAIIILIVCSFIHLFTSTDGFNYFWFEEKESIFQLILLCLLFFWVFVVTKNWTKNAAYSYAERLFETTEEI